jgi:flagellar biosynthesis protein
MSRNRRPSAIALRYQPEAPFLDAAPRLVAKGQGLLAKRILDPDLLAALEPLDINELIPPELFQAVAIVLAALYRANAIHGGTSGHTHVNG